MRLEAGFDAFEPVPFDANVIVGRDENLSIGSSNAAVECGTSALLRFEQISERYRKSFRGTLDDRARVVGRVVVDDDDFPCSLWLEGREALERRL